MDWASLIGSGAQLVGKLFGGDKAVASAVGNVGAIADFAGKIPGVPTPLGAMSGAEAGGWQKDYMDNAYPGTTPWERLGAPGAAGSAVTADTAAKTEQTMQKRELAVRERIANNSNLAQIIAATSPMGAIVTDSAVQKFANSGLTPSIPYANPNDRDQQFQPHKVANIDADTSNKNANTGLTEVKTPGEKSTSDTKGMFSTLARDVARFSPYLNPGRLGLKLAQINSDSKYRADLADRIRRKVSNNGKSPARFE